MTYYETFSALLSFDELKSEVKHQTVVAILMGGNPDRIKAIEDAMNKVIKEKGWE
jgi:hypothetical protein